jgi:hypothetical protein
MTITLRLGISYERTRQLYRSAERRLAEELEPWREELLAA